MTMSVDNATWGYVLGIHLVYVVCNYPFMLLLMPLVTWWIIHCHKYIQWLFSIYGQ